MRTVSKITLGLVTAALAAGLTAPASAQKSGSTLSLHGEMNRLGVKRITGETRRLQLSHDEHRAVKKIEAALAVKNFEGAADAIAAAEAVAESNDARFTIAALQLQLGIDTRNVPLQDEAIETALATGVGSREQMIELYRQQGLFGLRFRDYTKAEAALNKFVELAPKDPEAYILLAEAKTQSGKPVEALSLLEQAISLRAAAKQPVPGKWMSAKTILASQAAGQR